MKVYGYARISTNKQNIERQIRNIQAANGSAVIIRETFTGTKFQGRTELDKLLRIIQSGDTVIFDSVSRMSRNADEGFSLYEDLFNKGVHLVFIKEPHINTETYRQAIENKLQIAFDSGDDATDELMAGIIESLNRYIMRLAQKQIQLAFSQSEKEVADLHQRTREGMVTAKLNGKRIGQPAGSKLITKKSVEAKSRIKKYNNSFDGALTNEETWKFIGISKMSFYKYKNEMLAENAACIVTDI
jgi:DNA invertase Pin-like site-specific DNA recombinase